MGTSWNWFQRVLNTQNYKVKWDWLPLVTRKNLPLRSLFMYVKVFAFSRLWMRYFELALLSQFLNVTGQFHPDSRQKKIFHLESPHG